jgi:hypothetical protein
MGQAGDPKGLAQVVGQGHHPIAQHQGRQQRTAAGTGVGHEPPDDVLPHGRQGPLVPLQHLQALHPQLAEHPLPGQAGAPIPQQRMSLRGGTPHPTFNREAPTGGEALATIEL